MTQGEIRAARESLAEEIADQPLENTSKQNRRSGVVGAAVSLQARTLARHP
jgi:hypothetical protein